MALRKSKHTITAPLKDSDDWYIMNLLNGQADIIEKKLARAFLTDTLDDPAPFVDKGYYMDKDHEERLFRQGYVDFMDEQDEAEIQIFYVFDYSCNFKCTYCYQEKYVHNRHVPDQKNIIDAFFAYLDNTFAGRHIYLTLFGGEPFLPFPGHRKNVEYFLDRADERRLSLAAVTNGYALDSYLPRLVQSRIREIQITLDGPRDIHDKRRPLHNGGSTFDKVSSAVNLCLKKGLPVNLRVVMDKQNMQSLPELARYAIREGWTASPLFKTQLGRNYELHSCQKDSERLFSRLGMYEALYSLIKEYPEVLKFHRPAFSISRFLFDEGEMPQPLFDSCPGAKTEWAFDYSGSIYSCTATVGKAGEELGSFYPEVKLYEDRVEPWQDRDIRAIEACRGCTLQLACGGGCASVARNKTGNLHSADCRPVRDLISLGISTYFNNQE